MEDTGLQLASARGTGVFGKHLSVWNPLFRVARNCCLLQGQLASDARTPDRGQLERSTKNHRCAQSDLFIHLYTRDVCKQMAIVTEGPTDNKDDDDHDDTTTIAMKKIMS